MHPRLRLVLIGAWLAAVALVLLTATLATRNGPAPAAAVITGSSPFKGAIMPAGVRAPDFALRDEEGKPVRMRDFRGKPVIVTFLFTECEDTCPLEAQQIRGALDRLADSGHEIPSLAIAVNPPDDTAERAQRFLAKQRMFGRMRFVLGSRAELGPVWRGFAIQPQTSESDHQARAVIVDADGLQRVGYPGSEMTPDRLAHDVRVLLAERARPT